MNRLLIAVFCALALAAPSAESQSIWGTSPAEERARRAAMSLTDAGALAGDTVAAAVMLRSASSAVLLGAIARLERDAARVAPAEAARRYAVASRLQAALAALPGTDVEAARTVRLAFLKKGAEAAAAAGDSLAQHRLLREAALVARDPNILGRAMSLLPPGARIEAVLSLLAFERISRWTRLGAYADTAIARACAQYLCAMISDDPARLAAALEAQLGRRDTWRSTALQQAVLATVAAQILPGEAGDGTLVTADEHLSLGMTTLWEMRVEAAVDSALARGDSSLAATLKYVRAYAGLPTLNVVQRVDAKNAAEAAAAAIALIPRQDSMRLARALSVRSLAVLRDEQLDSAWALHQAATALSANSSPTFRALLSRRGAIIAANRRDTVGAERLLQVATALDTGSATGHAFRVGIELGRLGRPAAALPLVRAAARRFPGWETSRALGEIHRDLGNVDSAVHHFSAGATDAAQFGRELDAAHLLAAAAEAELERGRLAASDSILDRAAAAVQRWPWGAQEARARILNDRGLVQYARGRIADAQALFEAAMISSSASQAEYAEAARYVSLVRAADTSTARARASELGRNALHLRFLANDRRGQPASMSDSGIVLVHATMTHLSPPRAMHRPLTDAWIYLQLARLSLRGGEGAGSSYSGIGGAFAAGERALTLARAAGHDSTIRSVQGVLGAAFAAIGRGDSASVHLAKAGNLAPAGIAELDRALKAPGTVPVARLHALLRNARARGEQLTQAQVLEALALQHFRGGRNARAATAYFDSAATLLADSVMQTMLWNTGDWHRVQLSERFARLYDEWTLAWLARAPEIGAGAAMHGAAAAADRGRGRSFDLLSRTLVKSTGALAEYANPFRASDKRPDSYPAIGAKLFSDVRGYSRGGTTVSYLVTPDTLVTWVQAVPEDALADSTHVRMFRRAISADSIAALVSLARAAIGADSAARDLGSLEGSALRGIGVDPDDPGSAQEALAALARLLLPPGMAGRGGDLLVIPSGPIAAVPFAALPLDSVTPVSAKFSVRYGWSLLSQGSWMQRAGYRWKDLTDTNPAVRRSWFSRAVVLGNPTMPTVEVAANRSERLSQLPGAQQEADAIARLLGAPKLTGPQGSLAALREQADSATIVHLATHGYAYATEERVGDSFVALAPTAGDDGLLDVDKLLAGQLLIPNADLVVLSACQTGLGQLTRSEGTLGLQRAFLAVGAKTVLASLWSVSDEATALMISSFYGHWLEDKDRPTKAVALQRAQEDVRKVPRFAHPRYWAAFQLTGDN